MKKSVVKKRARGIHEITHSRPTVGQRAADGLSRYAGSWGFIIFFFAFLLVWIGINIYFLNVYNKTFDIYPFILLNLILSCLAAVQAPIILMSQNRQSQKDRLKADYDFKINVKAEKGIVEMQKQLSRIEKRLGK